MAEHQGQEDPTLLAGTAKPLPRFILNIIEYLLAMSSHSAYFSQQYIDFIG